MNTESQVDPEYKRIMAIALSFGEYGITQNIMMERKEVARRILQDWKNEILWNHFHYLESVIKTHLHLK